MLARRFVIFLLPILYISSLAPQRAEAQPVPPQRSEIALVAPARRSNSTASSEIPPSAFMAGRVAIQLLFVESTGQNEASTEDWDAAQISMVQQRISAALDWWRERVPNARLSFDLVTKIVHTGYEPIQHRLESEDLWISDGLRKLGFSEGSYFDQAYSADDALRQARGSDWASTIFVVNSANDSDGRFADGLFAYAYINGPFLVITSDAGPYGSSQLSAVAAHEIGHIFGALDQYASAQVPCDLSAGYLAVASSNSQIGSCSTSDPSIMLDPGSAYPNSEVDASALGQIGYRDSDGDGIPDPLDTLPALQISIAEPAPGERPSISGQAHDTAYPSPSNTAITINRITRIEYRADGGDWIALPAADGAYDSSSESISATLPLYDGQHQIDVRAINSAGIASATRTQQLSVSGVGAAPSYGVSAAPLSNRLDITLALQAPDGAKVQVSEQPFFEGATWGSAGLSVDWQLSPHDGAHTIYTRFSDSAGLESAPFSTTVTLDREAPTGYAEIDSNIAPQITIAAQDDISGIDGLQLDGGAWQAFRPTLILAQLNRTSPQIRLRDAAGNISAPLPVEYHSRTYLPMLSTPTNRTATQNLLESHMQAP